MSKQSVSAKVKHQHGVLMCCPAPFHDFHPAPGPDGSTVARCAACGSTVSRVVGRFYAYGVRDAFASIAKAKRVAAAKRELAAIRANLRGRAGPAADLDDDADDGDADADAEVHDDAAR